MNLIPTILEALGLQENEEFNIKNEQNVVLPDKFRFTYRTFQIEENERWIEAHSMMLKLLLKGECEVVKKPWRPKYGEYYHYVSVYCGETNETNYSKNFAPDVLRVNSGNCYRTKEEAENHVDEWMTKVYGNDWKELMK